MADRVLSDAEHHAERDAGMYVCQCSWTYPERIEWINAVQCRRCGKPYPRHTQQSGSPI